MDQPAPAPEHAVSEPAVPEPDAPAPDAAAPDAAAPVERRRPRTRRRVTTPPPDGTDPTPAPEAPRHPGNENDDRMRADKPPHY